MKVRNISRFLQVLLVKNETHILLGKHNSGPYKNRWTGLIQPWNEESSWREKVSTTTLKLGNIDLSQLPPETFETRLKAILSFEEKFPDKLDLPRRSLEYQVLLNISSNCSSVISQNVGNLELKWVDLSSIPFDQMPADDHIWYPLVLDPLKRDAIFEGEFRFDGFKLLSHEIREVEKFSVESV